ncbi:MAG: DUF268 domain-containing protein [Candidatus Eremiobacteraeota bacterium]|nr:DUF268 domain-containing protein [Candidatus Eremiobacteraeota bacterium]
MDLVRVYRSIQAFPKYGWDYLRFRKAYRKTFQKRLRFYPCLLDYTAASGVASGHYFHQDLWVAQQIFLASPERHIDVGSRVDGFVAHVASFRTIEVIDIRPQTSHVRNIEFLQGNLSDEGFQLEAAPDSLSCLHALEHFGLGRYGDPIDPEGHQKAFANMHRLLRAGGIFYFSVPIGVARVEFNAHRVFGLDELEEMFRGRFSVEHFAVVDDAGELFTDLPWTSPERCRWFDLNYGCGIFVLRKQND